MMKVEKSQLGIVSFFQIDNILNQFVQPDATPGPTVTGDAADFWTLVAIASVEDGDPEGWADVAQSIYNRLASGDYGGKTIKELIIRDGQYQPTWQYPKAGVNGKANPEWHAIGDRATASAATGQSEGALQSVANALTDPTLQEKARQFVQGRTDFKGANEGYPPSIQRKSGDNWFGWEYTYKGTAVAKAPNWSSVMSKPSVSNPSIGHRGPGSPGYGAGGGLLHEVRRFLTRGTGTVMAPKTIGNQTIAGYQDQFLGINVGKTRYSKDAYGYGTGFSAEQMRKYEQENTKKQFVNRGGTLPVLINRENFLGNAFRDAGSNVQKIQDTIKKQEQIMKQYGYTPDGYDTMFNRNPAVLGPQSQAPALTPSKPSESSGSSLNIAYAPILIPGSVIQLPIPEKEPQRDVDYFDPFGRGVRNTAEGFAIT
jgi:hypothetical protein